MVHTGSLHHRKGNTEGRKWARKRKAHEEEEIIAEKGEDEQRPSRPSLI